MERICYRAGYKYILAENYTIKTNIKPEKRIATAYIVLEVDGALTIEEGYPWDGASGPAVDTPDIMRASLVHDALYELMRMGLLDRIHRLAADELLHKLCIEDGMQGVRAWYVYRGVRKFGEKYTYAEYTSPVVYAP